MKQGIIWIGTSNVVIPGNKQSFPEVFRNASRLTYYAHLFNTVEVNSSFYKVPKPATFEKWSLDTGENFRFSVKLWKGITHNKDLLFEKKDVLSFLAAYDMLGNKKGPLLIQFPGKISFDYYNEVETILEILRQYADKKQLKIAIEFRSPSWYVSETMEMLNALDASLVLHDMPKSKISEPNKKASFIYLRLHGKAGDYRGSYENEELESYARMIKAWRDKGKDVFVYFNNTIGAAFDNAVYLQQLCGQSIAQ